MERKKKDYYKLAAWFLFIITIILFSVIISYDIKEDKEILEEKDIR